MNRIRLFWQLFPSYVVITVVAIGWLAWHGRSAVREFYLRQQARDLAVRAKMFADRAQGMLDQSQPARLDVLAKTLGHRTNTRFTVILSDGEVVADSEEEPRRMGNHANRPEIVAALARGKPASAIRHSATLHEEYMYVALPAPPVAGPGAVVRASMPVTELQEALGSMERQVVASALLACLGVVAVSWWISRRVSRPLESMTAQAERLARGEFTERVRGGRFQEADTLAVALNRTAAELNEQMETIGRQHEERDAILASMGEAVLALDPRGAVIDINPAGTTMLQLEDVAIHGRLIHEVLRRPALLQFAEQLLASPAPATAEIVFEGDAARHFLARGNPLRDLHGQTIGVLIVLSEVTRLRQLEAVRREFVTNVGHELQTPITSIKGYAETLLDGALDDPPMARRSVETILEQADRLAALISDLMSLSRIERVADGEGIAREPSSVLDVVRDAIYSLAAAATEKQIEVQLDGDPALVAPISPGLVRQAVINLLQNAVRYSPTGSSVDVSVSKEDNQAVIRVTDTGRGIAARHLPRLFERFYRVEPSRSRKLGGTGLGLAIVKQVATAHRGTADVESTVDVGSTFTLRLPLR